MSDGQSVDLPQQIGVEQTGQEGPLAPPSASKRGRPKKVQTVNEKGEAFTTVVNPLVAGSEVFGISGKAVRFDEDGYAIEITASDLEHFLSVPGFEGVV